jgi:hypothetical protein
MKAGRYKLGCALIKRSLDVDARPGTLFTLAECYSRGGRYASAVANYDRFLAMFEGMPPDQQEQQRARAELSRSERNRLVTSVAWLTVSLPQNSPSNVAITLDGEEFAASLLGIATAVDPGPHVFTMHAPDGPLVEQRVDIAPGERKAVVLEVQGSSAGAQPPPPETDTPPGPADHGAWGAEEPPKARKSTTITPWVYVTGGVGVAGLVTGAVTGGLLLDKRSTIKSECPGPAVNGEIACSPKGKNAADAAQNVLAPVTEVALGVGVAGAIATIVILVAEGSGPKATATTPSGNLVPKLPNRVVPLVGLSSSGASVGVRTTW